MYICIYIYLYLDINICMYICVCIHMLSIYIHVFAASTIYAILQGCKACFALFLQIKIVCVCVRIFALL